MTARSGFSEDRLRCVVRKSSSWSPALGGLAPRLNVHERCDYHRWLPNIPRTGSSRSGSGLNGIPSALTAVRWRRRSSSSPRVSMFGEHDLAPRNVAEWLS